MRGVMHTTLYTKLVYLPTYSTRNAQDIVPKRCRRQVLLATKSGYKVNIPNIDFLGSDTTNSLRMRTDSFSFRRPALEPGQTLAILLQTGISQKGLKQVLR